MRDEELLPCPFCGDGLVMIATEGVRTPCGVDDAGEQQWASATWMLALCNGCGAQSRTRETKAEVVALWNRRVK